MKNRIRIESTENVITNAGVWFIPEDGEPVDIRRCVTAVDFHYEIGAVGRASLEVLLVEGTFEAEIGEVTVRELKRHARFRRTRRVWRRLVSWTKRTIARSLERELRHEIAREWRHAHPNRISAYSRTRAAEQRERGDAA